jgi:hypothetical protein
VVKGRAEKASRREETDPGGGVGRRTRRTLLIGVGAATLAASVHLGHLRIDVDHLSVDLGDLAVVPVATAPSATPDVPIPEVSRWTAQKAHPAQKASGQ